MITKKYVSSESEQHLVFNFFFDVSCVWYLKLYFTKYSRVFIRGYYSAMWKTWIVIEIHNNC